jgi:hypothetical protein
MIQIAVINAATTVTDAELVAVTGALQIQCDRDFAKHWGYSCSLMPVSKGQTPPASMWWLTLLDTADVANALGYHDRTTTGMPIGKVFVQTAIDDKVTWSSVASHELLEMLGDPGVNRCAEFDSTKGLPVAMMAYELCDAVESVSYMIGSVEVSDFLTPDWFIQGLSAGPFDHLGKLTAPMPTMLAGGYYSETVVRKNKLVWIQSTAARPPVPGHLAQRYTRLPEHGSRRDRRARRGAWKNSTIKAV